MLRHAAVDLFRRRIAPPLPLLRALCDTPYVSDQHLVARAVSQWNLSERVSWMLIESLVQTGYLPAGYEAVRRRCGDYDDVQRLLEATKYLLAKLASGGDPRPAQQVMEHMSSHSLVQTASLLRKAYGEA